jgi:hypothetical protein
MHLHHTNAVGHHDAPGEMTNTPPQRNIVTMIGSRSMFQIWRTCWNLPPGHSRPKPTP